MKKLIKSRRGVAIELAIGVMFLMIAFTIMLLSTAGLQNDHRVDDYRDFKESTEINNIGEYVVSKYETTCGCSDYTICEHYWIKLDNENNPISKKIMIDGKDTGYVVTVTHSIDYINYGTVIPQFEIKNTDGDVVLTIIARENGKIISWK